MSTNRNRGTLGAASLLAGALLLFAGPTLADRSMSPGGSRGGGGGGNDSRTDNRNDSRNDSRSQSRSESRSESRVEPRSAPRVEPRAEPRFEPRAEPRNDAPTFRGGSGGSGGYQPSAPNPAPGPSRSNENWRSGVNTPSGPQVAGPRADLPSAPDAGARFSPNPVPNGPSGPSYRDNPGNGVPRYGGGESRGSGTWRSGGGAQGGTGGSNAPNYRPPTAPGRSAGQVNPGGNSGNGNPNWRGGAGPSDGNKKGDIGDGTSVPPRGGSMNPGRIPSGGNRPDGTVSGIPSRSPVASWRPPARGGQAAPSGRPGSSGAGGAGPAFRPGTAGGNGSGMRTGPGSRPIEYINPRSNHRPPPVNRNRWYDGNRFYGGRNFDIVPLGFYDPWACYTVSSGWFTNVRFYYPYYYIGPYVSGFYYSPFYIYDGWFPPYIYPERVIYIERRIYLHDVVSDDDYYDPYGGDVQTSLRDTMDDIKLAWLDGDGGRLLQHINAAVPIRVYQKGVYKYSLEPEDYRDITKDALNRVETTGFEWVKIDKRASDEVQLVAKHTFRDPDGDSHTIRLTYTLEKARGSWWITETGTSAWNSDI